LGLNLRQSNCNGSGWRYPTRNDSGQGFLCARFMQREMLRSDTSKPSIMSLPSMSAI
jgi:hypothetical protein